MNESVWVRGMNAWDVVDERELVDKRNEYVRRNELEFEGMKHECVRRFGWNKNLYLRGLNVWDVVDELV